MSVLHEREQTVVDVILAAFKGAREIPRPLPPGRVLGRAEGKGVTVELVAVPIADALPLMDEETRP